MRQPIILLAALYVGLVAAFLPQVKAGQPGGITLGGHERVIVQPVGSTYDLWGCTDCAMGICVTVAMETGEITLSMFQAGSNQAVTVDPVLEAAVRTRCLASVVQVEGYCASGVDCKYQFRVDRGPAVGIDLDYRSGNEPIR